MATAEFDAALKEARTLVGRSVGRPGTATVDRSAIAAFVEAVNDLDPLWCDDEFARTTRYAGVIAPPTFVNHVIRRKIDVTVDRRPSPPIPLPLREPVNGGIDYEFFIPLRPGDTINSSSRIASVDERQGSSGPMILLVVETIFTNSRGTVVATSRHTTIYR